MNIVDQIGFFLEAHMPGVNVSQGTLPDPPDRCVAVFGVDLNPHSEDGVRVRIHVRSERDRNTALHDAEVVVQLLDDFEGLLHFDGNYVTQISIESGPAHIGADQNQRQAYSINIRVFYCE